MLAERRDRCGELLREHFPEWTFHEAEGGLSYWIELPGMLATQLAARAEIWGSIWEPERGLVYRGRLTAIYVCPFAGADRA
jgi:DNA-binding transcriptional MocR family regulator